MTFRRILACGMLALGLAGCVSTGGMGVAEAPSAAATSDPIVLNSSPAPGSPAPAAVATAPDASPIPAAPGPVVVDPAPRMETGSPVPPAVAASPLPAPAPAPTPAATPAPVVAPATATADGEFPNINLPPKEPEGTLLPAEERARIIAELEALRKRQRPPAGGPATGPAALAKKGETHGAEALKEIEKCTDPAVAATDPDCATN